MSDSGRFTASDWVEYDTAESNIMIDEWLGREINPEDVAIVEAYRTVDFK